MFFFFPYFQNILSNLGLIKYVEFEQKLISFILKSTYFLS